MKGLTQTTRLDVASDTIMYVGKATVGSSPSEPVWRIFRITSTAAGSMTIEYVNGEANYNNVWDDRASYSYS